MLSVLRGIESTTNGPAWWAVFQSVNADGHRDRERAAARPEAQRGPDQGGKTM